MVLALWFDVGNERYTTADAWYFYRIQLWFDVGNERYTTGRTLCG